LALVLNSQQENFYLFARTSKEALEINTVPIKRTPEDITAESGHSFLDLSTSWKWVVSFMPQLLYPGERVPWHPSDKRLSRPQSQSEHGKVKILCPPPPTQTDPLVIQPIAIAAL
jgi:hypothetical protein